MSTSWITHRNEKILYVDYRGKKTEEALELLAEEASIIRKADSPLLVLDDMRDFTLTKEFLAQGKALGKELSPKVKKMAQVFAINGIKRIIANSFISFSGMQIRMFDEDEMEKAKEYLVM